MYKTKRKLHLDSVYDVKTFLKSGFVIPSSFLDEIRNKSKKTYVLMRS